MACSVPHSDEEIQAFVQKEIDEDMVHQKAILDLALQFDNACTTKEDLRKAYKKCNDIPQESRGLIDTFLKEESDKDYELNLSMYGKAEKIEKQMNAKLVWLLEKYKYRSQTHIDDSDLHLTPVLHSYSSTRVEPSPYTPNPVRIIPGLAGIVQLSSSTRVEASPSTPNLVRIIPSPAGIVQQDKLLKERVFILDLDGALMSTQEYMQKVVEDMDEDDDFKSGSWVNATNYVNAFGGSSCSLNVLGDLTVAMKDLLRTIPGTINHKVIDEGGYRKDITVGVAMILANVSVFTPKPSKHYLNITMRNVVEVFRKDTVPESGSG
ncbi:zinc finger, CCHC-type containing protein [Tanacetum coccineum]